MKKSIYSVVLFTALVSTLIVAGEGNKYPKGWFPAGSNPKEYKFTVVKEVAKDGSSSVLIESLNPAGVNDFGTLMQSISAENYLGKRLRLSGYIKTKNVDRNADLWMRVDGEPADNRSSTLSFDNMMNRGPKGTTEWKKFEIVLDVPANAKSINYGMMLSQKGKAWFSNLKLEEVDNSVPVTNMTGFSQMPKLPVNLNFEE